MTFHTITSDLNRIENILATAQANGDYLTETAYYSDYIQNKRCYLAMYISSLSSGTIAGIIGTGYYKNINYAVNNTVTYIYAAEPDDIAMIDRENIEKIYGLILKCYKAEPYANN